ncbi:galactosylgalactosylxylosylprotein 3-beta-glucuronosyltransferase S-like [Oppia nitens]|uniref:galactosylgalactosylxylosylprotein 3-beta-glucuronosyltransferase S-like n=1 Tax=Oppia nitens TaxID=1686743 RepID=UPI0023DC6174|nr:galactosylgalactosylxylosylprotein 3-beta-glucuronosyltransferase S-like [Oppia nitens]
MNRRFASIILIVLFMSFIAFLTLTTDFSKNSLQNNENEVKNRELLSTNNMDQMVSQLTNLDNDNDVSIRDGCKCNCDMCDNNVQTVRRDNVSPEDITETTTDSINIEEMKSKIERPVIFVITPTYSRPTQMPDMTRLSQTLLLVKDIFWIVTEDSQTKSQQVSNLLKRTNIPSVHLLGPRPVTHLDKRSGRGVSNRLKALQYLRQKYTNTSQEGVIYFADDDNAYDIRIFEEMRFTKKVSMFPVGLIAKTGLSTPIVSNKTAKIIGFHDPFINRRKYAVDMAGFAVNLQLFLNKSKATMPYKVGYEEDYFIKSLGIQLDDIEPKADNCTQILVWHTKTLSGIPPNYDSMAKQKHFNETNLPQLYDNVMKTL